MSIYSAQKNNKTCHSQNVLTAVYVREHKPWHTVHEFLSFSTDARDRRSAHMYTMKSNLHTTLQPLFMFEHKQDIKINTSCSSSFVFFLVLETAHPHPEQATFSSHLRMTANSYFFLEFCARCLFAFPPRWSLFPPVFWPFCLLAEAFSARRSFFMRGSTTLNRPLTPWGLRTRFPMPFLATTYVVSGFFWPSSPAFLYTLHNTRRNSAGHRSITHMHFSRYRLSVYYVRPPK